MSWRGFKKAIVRFPENIKHKTGGSKGSQDEDFSIQELKLKALNEDIEKFSAQVRQFKISVTNFSQHQVQMAILFKEQFLPNGKHDKAQPAFQFNELVEEYHTISINISTELLDELESLDQRVINPLNEVSIILKSINKLVAKRSRKSLDLNRHISSLEKLRQKPKKDIQDEKKLYKLEIELQQAREDFTFLTEVLLEEFPKFWLLYKDFIIPLFAIYFKIQNTIYNKYSTHLGKLTKYQAIKLDQKIVDCFNSREPETSQIFKALEAISLSRRKPISKSYKKKDLLQPVTRTNTTSSKYAGSISSQNSIIETARPQTSSNPPPYTPPQANSSGGEPSTIIPILKRPLPTPPNLMRARALYDFESQEDGDLPIKEDDIIEIVKKTDNNMDWWTGRLNGKVGIFPANYVKLI